MHTVISRMMMAMMLMAIALAAVALPGCGLLPGAGKGKSADATAEEINRNSTLPLALLTPHDEVRDSLRGDGSIDSIDNFMSFDYYAEGYALIFSGYPNDDSEYCLTEIEITSGDYDIFGVRVSDDMERAAQVFSDYGYQAEGDDASVFIKDGITISLEGDDQIEEMRMKAPTSYTSGNLY